MLPEKLLVSLAEPSAFQLSEPPAVAAARKLKMPVPALSDVEADLPFLRDFVCVVVVFSLIKTVSVSPTLCALRSAKTPYVVPSAASAHRDCAEAAGMSKHAPPKTPASTQDCHFLLFFITPPSQEPISTVEASSTVASMTLREAALRTRIFCPGRPLLRATPETRTSMPL